MAKADFPVFEKTDGDEHITYKLRKEHVKEQESITEDQLEGGRVKEKNQLTEAQLESKRTGPSDKLTEKNLNDSKPKFGSSYRNEEAHTGDINKLEEKRISAKKMEDEKYESASATPKSLKWWEMELGKDQLKLAGKKKKTKTPFDLKDKDEEEPKADDKDKEEVDEEEVKKEFAKSTKKTVSAQRQVIEEVDTDEDMDDEDLRTELADFFSPQEFAVAKSMTIVQDDSQGNDINLTITYTDNSGDEDTIRDAAYHKIIVTHPELKGKIDQYSFDDPSTTSVGKGTITLYVPDILEGEATVEDGTVTEGTSASTSPLSFEEETYHEVDAGGTPMAIGKIKFSATDKSADITKEAVEFIKSKHPELPINANSLDSSKMGSGVLTFAIAKKASKDVFANFPVEEVNPSITKKN